MNVKGTQQGIDICYYVIKFKIKDFQLFANIV